MIKPEEIKEVALKWWQPFLISYINNEPFFPRQIDRIGKVKSGDITGRFELLQREIENLYVQSKNKTGVGYLVKTTDKNFRRSGSHELPDAVEFESIEDYLYCTGKKKEWIRFQDSYQLLLGAIPALKTWALANPILLCTTSADWNSVIKVCKYFLDNPRPALYIRQLPVDVHTKFIEDNSYLLQSLLDFLIPLHIRNAGQKKFAERYYLKHDEPLIRIRILDKNIATNNDILDISIRLSDLEKNEWACKNVLVAENKINFLTLPDLPSSIAIWSGGGFNVSYLKNAQWLNTKSIYYWGDIDEHGFQILHQLRSYFPQTKSIMMNTDTFERFQDLAGNGEKNKAATLSNLNSDEALLYQTLKERISKNRLEQEKIPQYYIEQQIAKQILN
ncbi:MAG: hypothetical protein HYR66_17190 [Sphingobacteriales bacterium]|nr:hypothetical protein [Sphingobacteriales bacterium]MBI3717599.1 hypothetical protein [Sphingobacteriales bacterium]